MLSPPFDAKAKIEELRSIYGDAVVRPLNLSPMPRRPSLFKGLAIAAVMLTLGVILAFLGVAGMSHLDHQDTAFAAEVKTAQEQRKSAEADVLKVQRERDTASGTEAEKADQALAAAKADLRKAEADWLRLVSKALSLPEQVTELRSAFLSEVAATKELEVAKAELNAATNRGPPEEHSEAIEVATAKVFRLGEALAQAQRKSEEATSRLELIPLPNGLKYVSSLNEQTSLGHFAVRSVRILSPALLTASVLALLAAAMVMFVPWVRNQAGLLFERVVDGASRQVEGPRNPLGSLGNLAARATVMTTAAAVTVGAFTLAVPGNVIDLVLDQPQVSSAGVSLGRFDVTIPGKKIVVPEDRIIPSFEDDVRVGVPEISVRIPDVHVSAEADIGESLANELRAYRDYLENMADESILLTDLQNERVELLAKVARLETELALRSALEGLAELEKDLSSVKRTAETTQKTMESFSTNQEAAGAALAATTACQINNENAGPYTTLFRQGVVKRNCEAYDVLAARFPQIGTNGCVRWDRFSPLKFWTNPSMKSCTVPAAAESENASRLAATGG